MPRKAIRRPRRKMAKKGPVRKGARKTKANLSPMNQHATIVETIEFDDLLANKGYQGTFTLSQFYRATTVAKNFQFYRPKVVKWEYMPYYNTFQDQTGNGAIAKPQMYHVMNRDQDPYWASRAYPDQIFSIQACGADPKAFTRNTIIQYKPNWCSPGLQAYTRGEIVANAPLAVTSLLSLGVKKQFGWVATPNIDGYLRDITAVNSFQAPPSGGPNPSFFMSNTANAGVVYNGHNFLIEQENAGNGDVICKLVCTVEWEFKGPKENYSPSQPPRVSEGVPANTTEAPVV